LISSFGFYAFYSGYNYAKYIRLYIIINGLLALLISMISYKKSMTKLIIRTQLKNGLPIVHMILTLYYITLLGEFLIFNVSTKLGNKESNKEPAKCNPSTLLTSFMSFMKKTDVIIKIMLKRQKNIIL